VSSREGESLPLPRRQESSARFRAARLKELLTTPFRREAWDAATDAHFHMRIGNAPPCTNRDAALDAL
jgi:hypothetical protein